MTRTKKTFELLSLIILTITLIGSAFYLAQYIIAHDTAHTLVAQFGLVGIVVVALVCGLNVFVPLHAASFTPAFVAAGFSMSNIIIALLVGTLIADSLSFQIARWGKRSTRAHFPKFDRWLTHLKQDHHRLILPIVFIFSAVAPLPSELILIPVGLMGYRFWHIIIPLALGTLLNYILYTYGFLTIFETLF